MDALNVFCRQIRARSAEHRGAIVALSHLPGQMVSVLRQELDSLVRTIFILSQKDRAYRRQLIEAAVSGIPWTEKGSRRRVTDREMVDLADKLHGWTKSVYKFGCAFIHLSNLHDYRTREPLSQVSTEDREAIIEHLRYYHGGPNGAAPTFDDIVPYLPRVLDKISSNLECYIKSIEADEDLEP